MSTRMYKKHLDKGCTCPFCGSEEIEGEGVDIEGVNAYQEVNCYACGGSWRDQYVLTTAILHPKETESDERNSKG